MHNVGVIDTFLNTFTTYIDSGFGLIQGEITSLASTLIVIDITLAGRSGRGAPTKASSSGW
ncbi:type IV secretory pathway TrbL component [Bradyrhizobium sp. i1.15.2]